MHISGIKTTRDFYNNNIDNKPIYNQEKVMNNIRKREIQMQELKLKNISDKLIKTKCKCNKCRPQI